MPRGPAPQWRARKPPVVDDYLFASVTKAGGKHHPQTGHYATLYIRDLGSKEEALEYRRALHRCAHYLSRTGQADISVSVDRVTRQGNKYTLSFRAIDKTAARAYVLQTYGPDPSKWPYNPRRRGIPT